MAFPEDHAALMTAPVNRALRVTDPGRSDVFYREVLGFEARAVGPDAGSGVVAELVRGPARIQLVAGTPEEAPSPGVVFLQTQDVAALHAEIAARGGRPGPRARVNWLKYEVFEVRDPHGHTFWFGQSYNQPDIERPDPMLLQALPELPCQDVAAAVAYYRDVLGFHINYQQHDLGVMDRDRVTLLLVPHERVGATVASVGFYVRDADALHAELSARGARVQGEPVSHPWGLRDFSLLDQDGNTLIFSQPFE